MSVTAKILLGIDAGFANTGLSAFVYTKGGLKLINARVITTEQHKNKKEIRKSDDDIERAKVWTNEMQNFLSEIKYIVNDRYVKKNKYGDIENGSTVRIKYFAAVEFPTGGAKSGRANRCMGIATGSLATFLLLYGIAFEQVTPTQVKKIVKSTTGVTKDDIIKNIIPYIKKNDFCKVIVSSENSRKKFIRLYSSVTKITDSISLSKFEHVADSISAVKYVIENSQFYKIFIGA